MRTTSPSAASSSRRNQFFRASVAVTRFICTVYITQGVTATRLAMALNPLFTGARRGRPTYAFRQVLPDGRIQFPFSLVVMRKFLPYGGNFRLKRLGFDKAIHSSSWYLNKSKILQCSQDQIGLIVWNRGLGKHFSYLEFPLP